MLSSTRTLCTIRSNRTVGNETEISVVVIHRYQYTSHRRDSNIVIEVNTGPGIAATNQDPTACAKTLAASSLSNFALSPWGNS